MSSNSTDIQIDYSEVMANLGRLKARLTTGLTMITATMATKMEAWAKDNATWTDRTGNARQSLRGRSYWEDANKIVAQISHGVDYGIWLELANQKKYAILEETIEAHKSEILDAWAEVVKL